MTVQISTAEDSGGTLVKRVMAEIRQRITRQRLAPGTKLPSIRNFAAVMKVSKSTVVVAYDRLTAEGVIQARRGAGFYVASALPPLNLAEVGPIVERDIDPLWVSRQSLEAEESALKPGCGWLPASWMPQESIGRALRAISRSRQSALSEYGTPHGFTPLRQHLLRRMGDHQIRGTLEQVMLTGSGTQSIDLLCRFFVEPGDTVLVDDPCYFNFHALLKAHRVKVVSVPYLPDGPDLELFEKALIEHQPRLYITNSAIHNPTGAVLSPVVAHRLLKLAEHSDIVIIEDDIFADLEIVPAPRLAALDGLNRVVHIGSFSKTLSASIRCGFIAGRQEWIDGLVDLKIATSFGGEPFAAELTWRVLEDGSYRKHLTSIRQKLAQGMGETSTRLKAIGIEPWIMPQAGMYIWCRLPHNLHAVDVARRALEKGVILAPGNVFSLREPAAQFLRFNVSQSASKKIFDVLQEIFAE